MNTGDAVGPGMPARDRANWAKEMILGWIDAGLADFYVQDWDEEEELRKQRNRVAKFLGFTASERNR